MFLHMLEEDNGIENIIKFCYDGKKIATYLVEMDIRYI